MSPKPDGSEFEWEQKLASATVEALDDLERDAKDEINAFCEQAFSTLKERGGQKIHYLNMLRTAMSKKREVLTPHEQSNPASATSAPPPPPQPSTTATSAPPPPPLGAGGPPPPPPPPLPSSAGPQAPSAHALKQQEEKRKREQRQQALAAAKQRGVSAVEKNEGDALVQIKKKANADLKEIQQKIRDFKNEIAYVGGPPLEKLAREREEVKKNVDDEINDTRNLIERLLKQMSAIEKNDRLKDIKADVEELLHVAQEELKKLIAKKDQTLANINAALAKYDNGIERLELELETQKAYVQGLLEGSKTKSEAKAKANKTPEQILNDAFASQDLEFAKLEHYNDAEKAVIRAMLYRLNPKSTGNENALLCNEPNLQKIFQPAIKFQKIKYSDLKKELGRSLFEDEKKPDKIAKPPKSDAPSVQDQPGLAGAGMNNPAVGGAGVGGTAAPGAQQPPPYVAPSGPQKDISQEDTALKILKNIFKSIDIKDRYARAGGKKSFVSMYIKKQHKDRPKQIDDLQAAVAKATSAIEALSTNVDNSNNQQNLKAIFDDLDKTMEKIKADMQQAGHKFKGTSRMENVLKNLELETQKMKAAVGIEGPKPRESKKMS